MGACPSLDCQRDGAADGERRSALAERLRGGRSSSSFAQPAFGRFHAGAGPSLDCRRKGAGAGESAAWQSRGAEPPQIRAAPEFGPGPSQEGAGPKALRTTVVTA